MQKLVNEIEVFLSNKENVVFGYLFGSYATGSQTSNSDVDLALYLKDKSLDAVLEITYRLSKLLKKEVDITLLNSVKDMYILEEIFKDGMLVKDNAYRKEFEVIKQHDILDYKSFRKMIDAA